LAQFILAIIAIVFIKLLLDVYKEHINKKDSRPSQKGGEVIDLSNAWIDLNDMPYNQRDYLLTGKELALYKLLQDAFPVEDYVILPRVRLADFISVSPEARNRIEYANRIKERSADILICEASNLTPVAVVLFEAETEGKKKQLADQFIHKICDAVGLPCLSLKTATAPSISELKAGLKKAGLHI
jgi:hypothetical protein